MKQISGNKLLVKALKEEGVEYVFGYPGACLLYTSTHVFPQVHPVFFQDMGLIPVHE